MSEPAAPAPSGIDALALAGFVAALFEAAGLAAEASQIVAENLVEADLAGQASHGVMLVDMYIERLRKGSVGTTGGPQILVDRDAAVVLDGRHGFGQLIGRVRAAKLIERVCKDAAGIIGLAAVENRPRVARRALGRRLLGEGFLRKRLDLRLGLIELIAVTRRTDTGREHQRAARKRDR